MKQYLAKWALAGLVIPLILLGMHQVMTLPDSLIIALWPSSIVLMALDTSTPSDIWNVVSIWSLSLSLNMAMYLVISLLFKMVGRLIRNPSEDNS